MAAYEREETMLVSQGGFLRRPDEEERKERAQVGWYLAVDDCVLSPDNHLARGRDHEGRRHGAGVLALLHLELVGERPVAIVARDAVGGRRHLDLSAHQVRRWERGASRGVCCFVSSIVSAATVVGVVFESSNGIGTAGG
jgi:hypothetical protein